jgi:hypothetical protein
MMSRILCVRVLKLSGRDALDIVRWNRGKKGNCAQLEVSNCHSALLGVTWSL